MIRKAYLLKTWRVGVFIRLGDGVYWGEVAGVLARTAVHAIALAKAKGLVLPVVDGVDHAN